MKHLICVCIMTWQLSAVFAQSKSPLTLPTLPGPLAWENEPALYSIEKGRLTIEAGEKTDMFRDPNVTYNTDNAPKLLFKPDADFVLTASVEHAFAEKWDGGALVLKNDSLNWVKLCYEKDYTGAKRIVTVVTKNISDDCNSISLTGNKVFFKVAKAGPVITLYVSGEGKDWLLVRHFQMERADNLRVGFLAQAPVGKKCRVVFDNIRYEQRKIKDPYTGE